MDFAQLSPQALVHVCAMSTDPSAWDQFIKTFTPVVSATARRVLAGSGMFTSEIHQDRIQDVFLKVWDNDREVCKQMDGGAESFPFGYLQKVTRNLVRDFIRSECAKKRGSGYVPAGLDELQAATPGGSMGSPEDIESQVMRAERTAILEKEGFSQIQIKIFWRYYGESGDSAKDIAEEPGSELTVKGVESLLHRMSQALRKYYDP